MTKPFFIRALLRRPRWLLAGGLIAGILVLLLATGLLQSDSNSVAGAVLYRDNDRPIVSLAAEYQASGRTEDARLLRDIADKPNTTWLTGPSSDDPQAAKDIALVTRTSTEASAREQTPVYELYAIPQRDACAGYSAAGFQTGDEYLAWIDKIIGALRTKAVFSVEADAVAHTFNQSCLSDGQKQARYALIKQAVDKLKAAPYGAIIYIDAGHPEWFPDPMVLVEPLQAAGVDKVRGIAVNVSFFEATDSTVRWAQQLTALLGDDKGAIIDTSRNGRGAPPRAVTGEARWCNPSGRGLGMTPTTTTNQKSIDAYLWIKNPGESDGACFGNPPAGTLSPELALELARNANR